MTHIHFCTLLLICALLPSGSLWAQAKEEFVLVKKEGTVTLYERWLMHPAIDPPVKAREMKGVFYYNNTVAEGLRLLRDEKRADLWKSNISEFKIFPSRDSTTWHEYSYHDIPWPVNDQDHFMEYRMNGYHAGKMLLVAFESKVNHKLAPERAGVNRIHLSGSWMLEQITSTKVRVTYKVLSKPVGIPKVVADPFIRGSFITTFQNFIVLMEETASAKKVK